MKFKKLLTKKVNNKRNEIFEQNQEFYQQTVETYFARQEVEEYVPAYATHGDVVSEKRHYQDKGGINRKLRIITSAVLACLIIIMVPIFWSLSRQKMATVVMQPAPSVDMSKTEKVEIPNVNTPSTPSDKPAYKFDTAPSVSIDGSPITAGDKTITENSQIAQSDTSSSCVFASSESVTPLYLVTTYNIAYPNNATADDEYASEGTPSSTPSADYQGNVQLLAEVYYESSPDFAFVFSSTKSVNRKEINGMTVEYLCKEENGKLKIEAIISLDEGGIYVKCYVTPSSAGEQYFFAFVKDKIKPANQ